MHVAGAPPSGGVDLISIREALEASWSRDTSYRGVWDDGNPALGQCYPTVRVVQQFLPSTEIVKGLVRTGVGHEVHFWNELGVGAASVAIDLTWQQFPPGSVVVARQVLDRHALNDTPQTVARCDTLLADVQAYLAARSLAADRSEPRFGLS